MPDDHPTPEPDRHAAERRLMVAEQLAARGIRDTRVLDAIERIPRERFLPPGAAAKAYADGAQPIDCLQTISQPYMVARMTELLELSGRERVLEIGTGSGYQTAILATLAKRVYSVEWYLKLLMQARTRLDELRLHNIIFRCGDGSHGWPEHAPFDAILCTAGAPDVPAPLVEQLVIGGRLVAPIGPAEDQDLIRLRRTESGVERETLFRCRFVKLQGEGGWSSRD